MCFFQPLFFSLDHSVYIDSGSLHLPKITAFIWKGTIAHHNNNVCGDFSVAPVDMKRWKVLFLDNFIRRTRVYVSSRNVAYQVKLPRKRTFHLFILHVHVTYHASLVLNAGHLGYVALPFIQYRVGSA